MLKIEMDKIDELCEISDEFNIIMYLKDLVFDYMNYEYEEDSLYENIHNSAVYYLWQRSTECACKLKKLIESKDFTQKV